MSDHRFMVDSIASTFRQYQQTMQQAMQQLSLEQLTTEPNAVSNSVASIARHIAGNLRSRFTHFLSTDGEKPDRNRDHEFSLLPATEALYQEIDQAWQLLQDTLANLEDADLSRTIYIRQQPLLVMHALHRALAHISSHVGQIVYVAKLLQAEQWSYLSIPPGQSEAYNRAIAQAAAQAAAQEDRKK